MMANYKGFSAVLIFLILLIVMGFIGAFLYLSKLKNYYSQSGQQLTPTLHRDYNPLPQPSILVNIVTVKGKIVCLPHKDASGPQTKECAIGLQGDNGKYYGLKDLNQQDLINGKFRTGARVTATGRLVEDNVSENYDVLGYIEISSITEL